MFGRSYHSETQWRAAVRQPPALRSIVTGVSRFHASTEAHERRGGAHEGDRLGWLQNLIGPDLLARRHRGDPAALARAMAEYGAATARLASGELFATLPLRRLADLPGGMMAEVDRGRCAGPLDAPIGTGRPSAARPVRRGCGTDTFPHRGLGDDIFTSGTLDQYAGDARRWPSAPGRRTAHLMIGPWTHSVLPRQRGPTGLRAGRVRSQHRRQRRPERRAPAMVQRGPRRRQAGALAGTAPGAAVCHRRRIVGDGFDRYPVPGTRVEDWHLQPDGGLGWATAATRRQRARQPTSTTRPTRFPPSAARRCSGRRCRPARSTSARSRRGQTSCPTPARRWSGRTRCSARCG